MAVNGVISVLLAIVFVAGLTVALSHDATAKIVKTITGGFSSALSAAMGH